MARSKSNVCRAAHLFQQTRIQHWRRVVCSTRPNVSYQTAAAPKT